MAVVRLGSLVGEARASIGSTVFSKNRGGNYVRNRTVPVNPQTPAQIKARASFKAAAGAWVELPESDKEAWQAAAETVPPAEAINLVGEAIVLTGQNFYQRINASRAYYDQAFVSVPPSNGTIGRIQSFTVDAEIQSGDLTLEVVPSFGPDLDDSEVVDYWGTTPRGAGSLSNRTNEMRYFLSSQVASPLPTAALVGAAYVEKFGQPPIGSKLAVGIRVRSVAGLPDRLGVFGPLLPSPFVLVDDVSPP